MATGYPSGFLSNEMKKNLRLIWLGTKHQLQDVACSQAPSVLIELKAPISHYSLHLSKKIPVSSSEFCVSTSQLQEPNGRGIKIVLDIFLPPAFSVLISP